MHLANQLIVPACFRQLEQRSTTIKNLKDIGIKNLEKIDKIQAHPRFFLPLLTCAVHWQEYVDLIGSAMAASEALAAQVHKSHSFEEGSWEQVQPLLIFFWGGSLPMIADVMWASVSGSICCRASEIRNRESASNVGQIGDTDRRGLVAYPELQQTACALHALNAVLLFSSSFLPVCVCFEASQ